jgi:translation initiation factor 2B subunit (eIF-2B alpha/beta/delta family)
VALNPYFERTPPDLVTGFITDTGVLAWSPEGFAPGGGSR